MKSLIEHKRNMQLSKTGTLYKFRSWSNENHRNALLKGEFFLSSPKYFNDPYDCQIFIDYSSLDTIDKRKEFVGKAIIRDFEYLNKCGHNLEAAMNHADGKMEDMVKFQEECNQIDTDIYQKYYGVLSLTNTWKPILMWSHYAENHIGVCIGIKEEEVIELTKSNVFGRGGLVNYDENYPEIKHDVDWFEKALIQSTSKANCWDYEEEYRMVKTFYPNTPSDEDRKVSLAHAISEVILGAMMPQEHKQQIIEFAKANGIKVYQAKKVPYKFEIDRVELV